jgi:SagB-type dehydrogenase family enzyme
MKKHHPFPCLFAGFLLVFLFPFFLNTCAGAKKGKETSAEGLAAVRLPAPRMDGGKPLMECLKERRSQRDFREGTLPLPVLSSLLWAANGINRPDSGKRTAPSAMNWQEIDIYVSTAGGTYLYDAGEHMLTPVRAEDVRAKTGRFQGFVNQVPVNLIYVADYSRMGWYMPESEKKRYAAAAVGFISQNVYLFCASENLATVVRGMVKRSALAEALGLGSDQEVILAQSVGYPEASE